jgi:thiamine biosynthesis protein ThiS
MRLRINGEDRDVSAPTLDALLDELDYAGGHLATAVNGEHVPSAIRDGFRLNENDRIEILSPMQGG